MGGVRIRFDPAKGREPHDPALGLGFWAAETGRATFSNAAMLTEDRDTNDPRGGWGLYYRRQFSEEEFNARTDLRIEVTVKVLSSTVSPASACVQFTTNDGRTFGLGFVKTDQAKTSGRVVLYADGGELLQPFDAQGSTDWLFKPVVLGSHAIRVDVKRTYILELLRHGPDSSDDMVHLTIVGSNKPALSARLADLSKRVAMSGLVFGHPVNRGAGQAQWYRLTVSTTGQTRPAELPRRIGSRRQLFLDDWIIDKIKNLKRQVGKPRKYRGNPVMRSDKPWEMWIPFSSVCVTADKTLRWYYQVYTDVLARPNGKPRWISPGMGYTESNDSGRTWAKPEFDFYPVGKHKKTNILHRPVNKTILAGPCVFRDDRDPDPSRRYKMFTSDYGGEEADYPDGKPDAGIYVGFSPDGIHWDRSNYKWVWPLASDTNQVAFWDERIGKYVAYVRVKPKRCGRAVARTESEDFEHWTPPELCFATSRYQFYSMGVTPYQGVYIGTPYILWEKTRKEGKRMSPGLAFSRDGWAWQMVTDLNANEAFIPNGPPGSMDARRIMPASSFVVLDDRILFLYMAHSLLPKVAKKFPTYGSLATLRLDGFVAMKADERPGQLLTKSFVLEGNRLYVNANCRPTGAITVNVLDEGGKPIPQLKSRPVRGNGIKMPIVWQGKADLNRLRGQPIRLKFSLRQARLYSFWCEN